MAQKYYAVKVGKVPGIYRTWDACREMVHGYPGAVYKSFSDMQSAQAFCGRETEATADFVTECGEAPKGAQAETPIETTAGNYAFVDGSFCAETGTYGYGGFLCVDGERHVLQGSGNDEEMAAMRNVAGEILGSMAAIEKAIALGLPTVTIYYDYMGIEMWATGVWKRNKAGTIAYYDFIQSALSRISIHFVKVKGHSGVEGNEEADRLAKQAAGILK